MENKQLYSLDSEKTILGTVTSNNKYMLKVIGKLEEKDFYSTKNQMLYKAMCNLYKNNISFDVVVLSEKLSNEVKNGAITLTDITEITRYVDYGTIESHVNIVKEKSRERELVTACKMVVNSDGNINSKIDYLQNKLLEVNQVNRKEKVHTMFEVMEKTFEKIERAYTSKKGFSGISTGIRKIDNVTNGLEKKDFIIFGARPSMGKTAFSLAVLEKIEAKVLYIQLDMSTEGMGQRMLSMNTDIENGAIARGRFDDKQMKLITNAFDRLSKKENIFIYEPSSITINEIRLVAKEIQLKHGLDVIIIDHIGKIKSTTKGSKYEQASFISNSLKAIAKELNVAMIGLCQLSRATEQRQDKRPLLSDLRDTGSIEEDADVIGLLYRDGYYKAREDKEIVTKDTLEINFAKCRNGRTGVVELKYNLQTQRLSEF
ncbi:DnaB-like helicase C-terminal domain-containing protein [Clostridium perfringens]|uniref:DNA 5'-3' helicase n=2 Tax=Clostridium perfringens TaxID=1502 RepID=A0AAP6WP15_CLOPF|nr:DnaB-like helicase C-terminal domain-containing protein [Clostridium perfringens]EDT23577.1 replicative DNA helicase [Clostridium perfringens B str. ATCC 3626]NGU31423.1 AAA family ATPase [Clostridium perfringens]WEV05457.1 AAA family ATPase [Clostridium perfringens B]HBI6962458.1 AAA family ATPase [Clostridium perfringens]